VAYKTYMLPSYTFDLGPWLGALNGLLHHGKKVTITVEVVGQTNTDWDIEGVLLLWRGRTAVVATDGAPQIKASSSFTSGIVPDSDCQGVDLTNLDNGTGVCSLTLKGYQMSGSGAVTLSDGSRLESSARYALHYYSDVISFNNTAQTSSYSQSSSHSSYWSTSSISKDAKKKKSLTHDFTYNWMNSGQQLSDGFWTNSFNFSGTDGARIMSQNHFQRLEMVEGNYSNYTVPPYIVAQPTHTVLLHTVDSFDTPKPTVLQLATATWAANKFNSSETVECSTQDGWKCWPRNPLPVSGVDSRRISVSQHQQRPISLGSSQGEPYRAPWAVRGKNQGPA
jgi:hypothetical protein